MLYTLFGIILIGILFTLSALYINSSNKHNTHKMENKTEKHEEKQEKEEKEESTTPTLPLKNLKTPFTLKELSKYNGTESLPIYVGIRGKVYDVSSKRTVCCVYFKM